jgi:hypothetical protein
VLAIDDGQPVVVVHQFVGGIGNSGWSAHVRTLLLLSPLDHASFGTPKASLQRNCAQAGACKASPYTAFMLVALQQ